MKEAKEKPQGGAAYQPHLDGLRAIAVVMVMGFHGGWPGLEGGFLGVDVFFVLSGFLIASALAGKPPRWAEFYWRRFFRLYPALLVAAVGTWVITQALAPAFSFSHEQGPALLYAMDYYAVYAAQAPLLWSHAWSLAVEAKFYLLSPLVIPLLWRTKNRWQWLLVLWLLASGWRAMVGWEEGWRAAYYRFDTRGSGLVLGMALALLPSLKWSTLAQPWRWLALALLPTALAFARWGDMGALIWAIPLAELATAVLIMAPPRRLQGWLSSSSLVKTGQLSYGLYLWHLPLMRLPGVPGVPWGVQQGLAVALTVGLAWASWRLVEVPVRHWAYRIYPFVAGRG